LRLFKFMRPPVPSIVEESRADREDAVRDLAKAALVTRAVEAQDAEAQDVVDRLVRSRVRNGFAPVIEASIINRHLGGAH
jgi:hypothetical protein